MSRRQAGRWANQAQAEAYQQQPAYQQQTYQQPEYQQPAPAPAPAAPDSMDDKIAQLTQLGQLRDQGVLTDAEFELQKSRILAS